MHILEIPAFSKHRKEEDKFDSQLAYVERLRNEKKRQEKTRKEKKNLRLICLIISLKIYLLLNTEYTSNQVISILSLSGYDVHFFNVYFIYENKYCIIIAFENDFIWIIVLVQWEFQTCIQCISIIFISSLLSNFPQVSTSHFPNTCSLYFSKI